MGLTAEYGLTAMALFRQAKTKDGLCKNKHMQNKKDCFPIQNSEDQVIAIRYFNQQ